MFDHTVVSVLVSVFKWVALAAAVVSAGCFLYAFVQAFRVTVWLFEEVFPVLFPNGNCPCCSQWDEDDVAPEEGDARSEVHDG